MTRPSRTAIAAVLVAAGVTVPCTSWYIVGSRATDQQAARLASAPMAQAALEANHLAEQVSLRLEDLLLSESRRPFEEYQTDERYLPDDCAVELALRSPLTEGPVDSLIWTHFQINEVGEISLPTLDDISDDTEDSAVAIQRAILADLECADAAHAHALHRLPYGIEERPAAPREGVITVGIFTWHTAQVKDQPALVAIREVATPAAELTQGFVVLSQSLESLLTGSLFPSRIRPGHPSGEAEAQVAIHGDAWTIVVEPSQAVAAAAEEAARLRSRFIRTFWAGSMTALLAGCAVVMLVWQTERIARERARFAAAAAHELRTPLTGLRMYGEMLADGEGDPTRIRQYARRVADEAERLGRVVTNVLKFSRLQQGGIEIDSSIGDLGAAVRESVERLKPALQANGAALELSVEESIPPVRFDPDALHQILQNLLDNAEKFSREADDRTIRVVVSAGGGRPTVSVIDRGSGMESPARQGLFRVFSRQRRREAPAGLGIGLTLVRELARAHGADFSHEAVAGGGTSFSVSFRAA